MVQPTEYRLHSNMVHLPPNRCNTRLMGLAVCAIFVVKGVVHGSIFCHLNLTQGKTGHLFAPINPEHQNSSDDGHRFTCGLGINNSSSRINISEVI